MLGSAASAWLALKENYGTVSDLGATAADKALQATKYTNGMDFLEHIKDLCEKWNTAVKKGADIQDNHFQAIVISSLPASWDFIVPSLNMAETLVKLITGLMVHWECLKEQVRSNMPASSALLAKTNPQAQQKPVCVNPNYKRTGHTIENCYWKEKERRGNSH